MWMLVDETERKNSGEKENLTFDMEEEVVIYLSGLSSLSSWGTKTLVRIETHLSGVSSLSSWGLEHPSSRRQAESETDLVGEEEGVEGERVHPGNSGHRNHDKELSWEICMPGLKRQSSCRTSYAYLTQNFTTSLMVSIVFCQKLTPLA